jgi:hypothetical protein
MRREYDENELCSTLTTLVQEWGVDNVIVVLPRSWSYCETGNFLCKVEYGAENLVTLKTPYYAYEMEVGF